ncbi:hypothetical protein BGZ83_010109 [Gryganskiella cystojenkinii]|nr:hypothetical protein BGZ83_010109 [Gryganskiella cystojenkinii]
MTASTIAHPYLGINPSVPAITAVSYAHQHGPTPTPQQLILRFQKQAAQQRLLAAQQQLYTVQQQHQQTTQQQQLQIASLQQAVRIQEQVLQLQQQGWHGVQAQATTTTTNPSTTQPQTQPPAQTLTTQAQQTTQRLRPTVRAQLAPLLAQPAHGLSFSRKRRRRDDFKEDRKEYQCEEQISQQEVQERIAYQQRKRLKGRDAFSQTRVATIFPYGEELMAQHHQRMRAQRMVVLDESQVGVDKDEKDMSESHPSLSSSSSLLLSSSSKQLGTKRDREVIESDVEGNQSQPVSDLGFHLGPCSENTSARDSIPLPETKKVKIGDPTATSDQFETVKAAETMTAVQSSSTDAASVSPAAATAAATVTTTKMTENTKLTNETVTDLGVATTVASTLNSAIITATSIAMDTVSPPNSSSPAMSPYPFSSVSPPASNPESSGTMTTDLDATEKAIQKAAVESIVASKAVSGCVVRVRMTIEYDLDDGSSISKQEVVQVSN